MNEKIKEIAEFDGWLIIPEGTYRECHNQTIWFGHGGKFNCYHDITAASDMPYLTDLNALHRVALDVMQQLSLLLESTNAGRLHAIIMCVMFNRPNSKGEYVSLVDAVYDAIVYLKNNEK